jgi:hypothetical protein
MCSSSIPDNGPRVIRKEKPKLKLKRHNYRERSIDSLRKDFKDRCAYSMQHVDLVGGIEHMEVDHFDSTKKKDYIQDYNNLFLAKRACNNKKQNRPTLIDVKAGLRFLNCCLERDYNECIFEDPVTHEVWGTTPNAKYHIRYLGLNSRNLVQERTQRFELLTTLRKTTFIQRRKPDANMVRLIAELSSILKKHIPEIELRPKTTN